MKLMVFKLMYRLTNDKRWAIRYVNVLNKKLKQEIEEVRKEVQNERN